MKIEKAIKELKELNAGLPQLLPDDRRDAVRLGVEALKELQRVRPHAVGLTPNLLPGETRDVEI